MSSEMKKFKKVKAHIRYKNKHGKVVPGTTTIISNLAKPYLIKWANNLGLEGIDSDSVKEMAGDAGTLTHERITSDWLGQEVDFSEYSPAIIDLSDNAMLKFYEWQKDHPFKPILVEKPLVSEIYQYGGTIDGYGILDDLPNLVDIKTSKDIYLEHAIQLAAYVQLLEENGYPVSKCRILRFGRNPSEGFQEAIWRKEELMDHWRIFKHLLGIHKLKKKIGG